MYTKSLIQFGGIVYNMRQMAKSKKKCDIFHPISGWQTQKNTLEGFKLPEGELKEIVRVNFGNELLNIVKGVSWIEEIIEEK